jgi:hypothetical protein
MAALLLQDQPRPKKKEGKNKKKKKKRGEGKHGKKGGEDSRQEGNNNLTARLGTLT